MTTKKNTITPSGWRIVIQDYAPIKITDGGIHLPDESVGHSEYLTYVGKVIALGPEAFKHRKFIGGKPWCKVGDWIVFARYSGQKIKFKGEDVVYRFCNDEDVLGKIEDPSSVIAYV